MIIPERLKQYKSHQRTKLQKS